MRTIKTMAALLVVTIAGTVLVGQEIRRAEDVLSATRKAIGKIDGLKSLSVEAGVQRNVGEMQLASNTELLMELPDKFVRAEVMTGPVSGGATTGFNGDKAIRGGSAAGGGGMVVIRMGGPGGQAGPPPAQKLSPEEQERADRALVRSSQQDLSRLMLGWFGMTHPSIAAEYTYAGEAESPDGKAYVVDVKNADGFAARLFVDESTHLPLMVTYKGPEPRVVRQVANGPRSPEDARKELEKIQAEPPKLADYTLFFEDWQQADGIRFPHRMRRAMSGTTTEEWTVTRVRINPKIDAKKFAPEQ
jgi:hypothetical protein